MSQTPEKQAAKKTTDADSSPAPRPQKLLRVFAEQIRFQIHRIADFSFAPRRDFQSVRNDPDAKTFFPDDRDRQTDSVNRNRTFLNHITQNFLRRGNFQNMIRARFFPAQNFPDAVNMAGDKMSAKLAARAQRPFQVHERSDFKRLKIRPRPRFRQQIELNQLEISARR